MTRPYNVLFLCTGNSARSLLAECLLRRHGGDRFRSLSAGSRPKGQPHPGAIRFLNERHHDTGDLRSKSWDEFAGPDSPELDFVFTVCDSAAGEACPVWPGQPITAHWGVEDPAAVQDEALRKRVFRRVYHELERRIQIFVNLPLASLDRLAIQKQLDDLARSEAAPDSMATPGD